MKTYFKTATLLMSIAAGLALAGSAGAADDRSLATPSPSFTTLSKATPTDLPAKAAELVAQAGAKERRQTTVDVVRTAVALNPAAAAAIVGSIAKSSPDMASVAAATAAALVPDQVAAIAHAAAAAAPKQAGKIVEALCQVLPKDYQSIANAVAAVAPGQGQEILAGLAGAIPSLQAPLQQVLAAYSGNTLPSVGTVLGQLGTTTTTSVGSTGGDSPVLAPPTGGAPYVPTPTHVQSLNPGSGGQVPTGGRNYASP